MSGVNRRNRRTNFRIALSGLLVALMLVLGYIESMIPLGTAVPGIKLGLSNGVLIFAVYMLDIPTAYCLMCLKVLLSGLMFGGVSAIAYAFAGGLVSLTGMCLLSRIKGVKPVVVSLAGGVLHNVGQVGLAMIILHTDKLAYYMAILTLVGAACGVLTGVAATAVMKHLRAAGWKQSGSSGGKRSWIAIALAALLIVGMCVYGAKTLKRPANNDVVIEFSTDVPVGLPAGLTNGQ